MTTWPHLDEVGVSLDFGSDGARRIGTIATTGETSFFAYTQDFLSSGTNPAPFCLPYAEEPHPLPVRNGAPGCMFADAVPDGWTRHLLDARLLEAGFHPNDLSPLDRLALVGGNGLGALSFQPETSFGAAVEALSIEDLAATITATKETGDAGLEVARRYAGSLGGMRPKANVWLDSRGAVSAAPGTDATPWIVKFPRPGFDPADAGPIEYAYSLMARAAGVSMTATRLLETTDGPGYFATARFDRFGERRYHFQSLAGLLDLDPLQRSSYLTLLGIERELSGADGPDEQLVRRMAFNVIAANRDDHTRNHGFLMDARGLWTPAPAFDVTFEPLKEHVLVVGANASAPKEADLVSVTVEAGGSAETARAVVREVQAIVDEWPSFGREAGLARGTIDRVETAIRSLRRGDAGPARAAAMAAARAWGR